LAGTYLFGAEILTLIYGVDLIPYRLDLCLVIVGGIFSMLAGIFSTMLTIIRRMKSQIIVYLISVVLSVFVSVVLIDTYGIIGGVLTNVITNMILFALLILDYLKNLKSVTFD
jgi:O-antigen/teichoic acid export membrane protein